MDDGSARPANTPMAWIIFLNAMSLGIVFPLFYFIFQLTDGVWMSIWIGILFAVDSAGRIVGRYVFPRHRAILIQQLVLLMSFALLAITGHFRATHGAALLLVYVSRFFGALATAHFQSIRFLIPLPQAGDRSGPIALGGFALGCALSITPMNNHHVTYSILETGGLVVPSICAAVVSLIALIIAVICRSRSSQDSPAVCWSTPIMLGTLLTTEAALGMFLCAAPLMQRETYTFTPANIALFLSFTASISLVTQLVLRSGQYGLQLIRLGLLLTAVGIAGFAASLQFSYWYWLASGYWLLWPAAATAAIGYGLLQTALPNLLKSSGSQRQQLRAWWVDVISCVITALAALFAAAIWPTHERFSYVIPSGLAFAGLALSLIQPKMIARDHALVV